MTTKLTGLETEDLLIEHYSFNIQWLDQSKKRLASL